MTDLMTGAFFISTGARLNLNNSRRGIVVSFKLAANSYIGDNITAAHTIILWLI